MSKKFIRKQDGRMYAICRSREDQLNSIHYLLKKGNVVQFHYLINRNKVLVTQFDLWLMVDAVTILYDCAKKGHSYALVALTDLINRPGRAI